MRPCAADPCFHVLASTQEGGSPGPGKSHEIQQIISEAQLNAPSLINQDMLSSMHKLLDEKLDVFFWPASRSGVMSAWWGHVPFAHWLVAALRPRMIVELGTHNGASFAAFCESVQRSKIAAQCFAVDTWQGDEHAGMYGEEIYADLKHFVAARYNAFAELVRSTFDEAQPYFMDGSIDLLHIDGLHTYEAVKHDFETWLPKLSDRGVVIFHDINVRERDFGVWRLWTELRQRHDGFEFSHAHGLGVLLVGAHPPAELAELALTAARDPNFLSAMQARLSELGRTLIEADMAHRYAEHTGQLEKANTHLNAVAKDQRQAIENLQRTTAEQMQRHLHEAEQRTGDVSARLRAKERELAEAMAQLDVSNQQVSASHQFAESTRQRLVEAERRIAELVSRIEVAEAHAGDLRDSQTVEPSEDWKTRVREQETALQLQRSAAELLASQLKAANESKQALEDRMLATATAHGEFVDAMHQSMSWRLTRPVRALKLRSLLRRLSNLAASPDAALASASSSRTDDADADVPPTPATINQSVGAIEDVLLPTASDPTADQPGKSADVVLIEDSGLFDAQAYEGTSHALQIGQSPIGHYLEIGESRGWVPSAEFDPIFYRRRYGDLACLAPGELLLHYIRFGRAEGRVACSVLRHLAFPLDRLDPTKPCMVVAAHEATRTGAAILSWNLAAEFSRTYNVVVLLRRGGPIQETFSEVACAVMVLPEDVGVHAVELDILAQRVKHAYDPMFVVANSVESRYFIPAFESLNVPCVALVHEFSSSVRPLGILNEMFEQTSRVVFSAQIVADSALRDYTTLNARDYAVLPQGACKLPAGTDAPVTDIQGDGIQERLIAMHGELAGVGADDFLVLGLGTITARKGVEFFIAAADRARRLAPGRRIVFAWIGKCYGFDAPYLQGLLDQVERADLIGTFSFWGELAELAPVYARADAVLLSSRLDPLPNVGIDASMAGIPVVCFDRASGMAEILGAQPDTAPLVVPYLDAAAAAEAIVAMANDGALQAALSEAIKRVAIGRFDMVGYAQRIEALALASVDGVCRRTTEEDFLRQPGHFNAKLYGGRALHMQSTEACIAHYLRASSLVAPRGRPRTGLLLRRPLEGFHPLIYAGEAPSYDESDDGDPLVHFLKAGRPQGRWLHPVIRPSSNALGVTTMKVAIHAHFHYTELFPDFVHKVLANRTPVDFFLTATSDDNVVELQRMLNEAKVPRARVMRVENRGRDIGPMLCDLPAEFFSCYDVVGHFHGKRSPHVDHLIGSAWREFLWQHLIGDTYPMLDIVMQAFAADSQLGLVFAEDPHLNDWDLNRNHADLLARRMGLDPLPAHLDFPQGTMFWARPAALRPMLSLGLSPADFPLEPLPIDGTLLHALERLLPFVAAKMDFTYAATYVESQCR